MLTQEFKDYITNRIYDNSEIFLANEELQEYYKRYYQRYHDLIKRLLESDRFELEMIREILNNINLIESAITYSIGYSDGMALKKDID